MTARTTANYGSLSEMASKSANLVTTLRKRVADTKGIVGKLNDLKELMGHNANVRTRAFDLVCEIAEAFAQPTKFEKPEHALATLKGPKTIPRLPALF